jgi:sugar lactone lactonase YvrE
MRLQVAKRPFFLLAAVCSLVAGCGASPPGPCAAPPGYVCTIAGTGELGFNRDGLAATATDLFLVSAVRPGPDGRLYVMDFNNQRLRRIKRDGTMQTIVGNGFHALADTGVPITDTPLENPIDFRFLSDGRIIIASYHDPRVLVVGHDQKLHAVAGTGDVGVDGDEGDEGPARLAEFIQLDGIAVAPDDTVYVSDSKAHRVRRIRDHVITTVAGTGVAEYSGDGGPATEAGLNWPTALELDPDGNLLIADARNNAVRRLTPDGIISTVAGTGKAGYSGDGGPATKAELNQPYGLALDDDGSLYIADRSNFVVRKVSPDGDIETIAGTGEEGATGDGGPAAEATFAFLARLALDDDGLIVADQSNSLVRRVTLR